MCQSYFFHVRYSVKSVECIHIVVSIQNRAFLCILVWKKFLLYLKLLLISYLHTHDWAQFQNLAAAGIVFLITDCCFHSFLPRQGPGCLRSLGASKSQGRMSLISSVCPMIHDEFLFSDRERLQSHGCCCCYLGFLILHLQSPARKDPDEAGYVGNGPAFLRLIML